MSHLQKSAHQKTSLVDGRAMKFRVPRRIRILLIAAACWLVVHLLYISIDGLTAYRGTADIAIVLGNPVNADSSLSPWLEGRVDQARTLYQARRVRKIFVSGGPGEEGVAEGDAMKAWLVKKHIPAGDIITDNKGINTYYTAVDFLRLNDSCHFRSAIVVTSFYHITRAKYILGKLGFGPVYGVASQRYFINDAYGMLREFAAFYTYLIRY